MTVPNMSVDPASRKVLPLGSGGDKTSTQMLHTGAPPDFYRIFQTVNGNVRAGGELMTKERETRGKAGCEWPIARRSCRIVLRVVSGSTALLAWVGRQGTRAIAGLVIASLLVPSLGAFLRPYSAEAIFVLLFVSFLRMDPHSVRASLARPAPILAATAWTSIGLPILCAAACRAAHLPDRSPDLFVAVMLQAIASPMMAAPALASLMGLDATLVLVTLVTSTALIPLTAPLFVHAFLGSAFTLAPSALGIRLFAILAGSAVCGLAARRFVGVGFIKRRKQEIDGFNTLVLFVFVASMMEGVGVRFLAAPLQITLLAILAFAVFFVIFCATVALFAKAGRERALAIGFMTCQRNMGLMIAAAGPALSPMAWIYFGLSQFPIYLSPYLLSPLTRRILGRAKS